MSLLQSADTLQAVTDTTAVDAGMTTAYDSVWATTTPEVNSALDQVMLSQDKLYVVLAVVLIIWLGILFFLYRTDSKLSRLERTLDESIPKKTA